MRRSALLLSALVLATAAVPVGDAYAQARRGGGNPEEDAERQRRERDERRREWNQPAAPLRVRPNAGPCPYVKVLYDAARFVEFEGGREASAAVAWTGEMEGLKANCVYRETDPIRVDIDVNMSLGRGPQAQGSTKTYRYWVAVTERNRAVLAKEYFDLTVQFAEGEDRMTVTDTIRGLTIPRAGIEVSGGNFEILIGFDVTPQMAEFNREGRRFRINAGQAQPAAARP